MNFSDLKVKFVMMLAAAGGIVGVHEMTGEEFGAAVAANAPIADHILAALGI